MLARKPRMLVTTALANKMARIVWGLLVKGGTYRAPAAAAQARRGHRGVGRAEGGHGATVGETGSGQPGCNTVLRVRHLDLDPLRELPCRPAVHDRARGRTDGSIRLRVTAFLMFSLALKGASTDVAWIGGVGALSPTRVPGHAVRTYLGRPRSSIRFSTSAAIATSVACRPSVWKRRPSPTTRFQREMFPSGVGRPSVQRRDERRFDHRIRRGEGKCPQTRLWAQTGDG